MFYWVDVPHLLNHLPAGENLNCFQFLVILNKAAIISNIEVFEWIYILISPGKIQRNGISRSHGKGMFNLIRNSQNDFQSDSTILHLHQKCLRVPVTQHPC